MSPDRAVAAAVIVLRLRAGTAALLWASGILAVGTPAGLMAGLAAERGGFSLAVFGATSPILLPCVGVAYVLARGAIMGPPRLVLTRETLSYRAGGQELSAPWADIEKVEHHVPTRPWYARGQYDQP